MESDADDLFIVSYRFKIAERNRIAKLKFIKDKMMGSRQRSVSGSGDSEKSALVNLTIPGTPVCSRYLRSMADRKNTTETDESENEVENAKVGDSSPTFEAALKTFMTSIVKLKTPSGTPSPVGETPEDPIEKYFQSSSSRKTYQRNFSEATQTLGVPMKGTAEVNKFFQESESKQSYARSFSEAVHEPKIEVKPLEPQVVEKTVIVERTIVSSPAELKHIDIKPKQYFDKSDETKTYHRNFSEVFQVLGESTERGKEEVGKYFESSKGRQTYARTFSEAVTEVPESVLVILEDTDLAKMSVPGTPISSRYMCNVGSEKSTKPIASTSVSSNDETFKLYHEELEMSTLQTPTAEPNQGATVRESLIEKYLAKSDVLVPQEINPKEYFEKSDKIQSYKREFSEVVQILEPSKARAEHSKVASVPGTPVDSRYLTSSFRERKDFKCISDSEDELLHDGMSSRNIKLTKLSSAVQKVPLKPTVINNDEELCSDMKEFFQKSLQQQTQNYEPVAQKQLEVSEERKAAIEQYLDTSAERKTYQRTFSEATSFLKPEKQSDSAGFKQPSSRKSSVGEKLNLSVPGTPVSSRYVMAMKEEQTSDSSDSESDVPKEKTKDELKAEFQKFIKQMDKLKVGDTSELVDTVNSENDHELQRSSVLKKSDQLSDDNDDADDEIEDEEPVESKPKPLPVHPKKIGFSPTSFQHRKILSNDHEFVDFWGIVLKKPTKINANNVKTSKNRLNKKI